MATSSITKNFLVYGEEQVEIFANAIEESANEPKQEIDVPVQFLKSTEEIVEFLKKREKGNNVDGTAIESDERGMMEDRIYSIDEIREKVVPIAEAYGVERVFLFGSYARGNATADSDIDLRVDKGKVKGFAFGGLYNALLDAFEKSVDVVTTMSLDADFLKEIAGEEVLLYGE